MTVVLATEAVDLFVERTIAAAGDDELATLVAGTKSNFGGVARAGCFGEVGFDAAGSEDAASFVELFAAVSASTTSVWIVNQERVAKLRSSFHLAGIPLVSVGSN